MRSDDVSRSIAGQMPVLSSDMKMLTAIALNLADLKRRRDQLIREQVAAGETLRAVGEAALLSHSAIDHIVKRDGEKT